MSKEFEYEGYLKDVDSSSDVYPLPGNISSVGINVLVQTDDSAYDFGHRKKKKSKKKKKGVEEEIGGLAAIIGLFRYAQPFDFFLMAVGFIASLINGGSLPMMALIFGKMTTTFINVAIHGFAPSFTNTSDLNPSLHGTLYSVVNYTSQVTREDFTSEMGHISMYYVYIGILVLVSVFIQTLCWEMACERQVYRLRQIFFSQILRQDISWYDANEDNDLPHKLTDDLERVREGIGSKFSMLTQYGSTFLVGIGIGFHANVKLTTAMIIIAPLIIGVSAIVGRDLSSTAKREQIRYGVAGGIASEVLNCIKLVASFGSEAKEIYRYGVALDEGSKVAMRKYYVLSVGAGFMFLITYGAFGFAFWFGSDLIKHGQATPGNVFTVFFSVMTGAFTISNALPFVNTVATAIGSATNIFEIIDRVPPIDSYSPKGKIPDKLTGVIEFKNVHFSYPTRPQIKVLKGLNVTFSPGQSVALVGASGAGKSTVIGLLLRFYDPGKGEVIIDGTKVSDMNMEWLRSQIGVVSQEPVLFGASIADNIRFGKESISELDIVKAATLANAHSFIKNLPNGYDTQVGDKGTMLSGGQKQRIAIARALVRDPKILLLDEATSALDAQSESVVQAALENAMKGRTTLIVAHRLSTIRNVDVIYALKDGAVFEHGSHDDLMAKEGLYFSLVEAQKKRDAKVQVGQEGVAILDHEETEYNFKRDRSSGVLSRASTRSRRKSSSSSLGNVYIGAPKQESIENLGDNVSFLRIFRMSLDQWPFMLLSLIGCFTVGSSMPIFSSLYADIFHTFTLSGADYDSAVRFWTIIYLIISIAVGFSNFLLCLCSSILTEKMIANLRLRAFTSIVKQAVFWFDIDDHAPGKIVTSLARDPPLIKSAAGYRAGQVIIACTSVITGVTIAFCTGWKLSLVLLIIAPIIGGAGYKQASLLRRNQKRDAKFMDEAGQVASEAVLNLKTVQALGKEKLFIKRYADRLKLPFEESKRQAYFYAITFAVSQAIIYVMYTIAFRYGAVLIEKSEMTPTSVYRIFFALSFCATAVGQTSTYFQDFSKAKLSLGFVYKLLSMDSTIDPLSVEGIKPIIHGKVTFRDVYFKYPSRSNIPILRGFNLTIEPGQTVALVGGSGCGKSTLIGLLERFYLPDGGKILLDDVDASVINLKWMRSHIGLVTQEPVLFDCSIKENIAYGAKNTQGLKDAEIFEAAKVANIHDFIVNLPQGYDTPVGERGAKLSGGQKQRIAIARALLRNPKILLLDEATSALDTESEKVVQEALDKARKGRTSIVIAHRLSTIQNADVIVVINKGVVAEKGTHEELKNRRGLYYELIKHQ